jgi:hypothetical protein
MRLSFLSRHLDRCFGMMHPVVLSRPNHPAGDEQRPAVESTVFRVSSNQPSGDCRDFSRKFAFVQTRFQQ